MCGLRTRRRADPCFAASWGWVQKGSRCTEPMPAARVSVRLRLVSLGLTLCPWSDVSSLKAAAGPCENHPAPRIHLHLSELEGHVGGARKYLQCDDGGRVQHVERGVIHPGAVNPH